MVSGDSVAGLDGNHSDHFSTKRVPEPDIKHRCLSFGYIHYSKDALIFHLAKVSSNVVCVGQWSSQEHSFVPPAVQAFCLRGRQSESEQSWLKGTLTLEGEELTLCFTPKRLFLRQITIFWICE